MFKIITLMKRKLYIQILLTHFSQITCCNEVHLACKLKYYCTDDFVDKVKYFMKNAQSSHCVNAV